MTTRKESNKLREIPEVPPNDRELLGPGLNRPKSLDELNSEFESTKSGGLLSFLKSFIRT